MGTDAFEEKMVITDGNEENPMVHSATTDIYEKAVSDQVETQATIVVNMMYCRACGKQISRKANSCPHCGENYRVPIYKKPFFWVIGFVLILGIVAFATNGIKEVDEQEKSALQETIELPTLAPNENVGTKTNSKSRLYSSNEVCTKIEDLASQDFAYFEVEYDESDNIFIICISSDGLAQDVLVLKAAGYDEYYSSWMKVKDAIISYYDTMRIFLDTHDYEDADLIVNVMNDQQLDNVLLSVVDGFVFYDVMAE